MNYWVACITEDNLKVAFKAGLMGFNERIGRQLRRFEPGDMVTFYVPRVAFYSNKKIRKFVGLAKVKGRPYVSNKPIWANGVFPLRINIDVVSERSCDVESLIRKLSFIPNKENWGSAFLSGIRKISEEDFNLVRKTMR